METDFLSDIEAEYHTQLLERGNLGKKKTDPTKIPRSDWTGENSWTSLGYIARVSVEICKCGSEHKSLLGIFHREETPSHATRETRLVTRGLQIPLGQKHLTIIESHTTDICPSCLTTIGF